MTDEMAVQAQRPSATPYLLGGAALGGAAGYGVNYAGWDRFFKPKTWQDAVADVNKNDKFITEAIEKGGDNKGALETIKENAQKIKEAKAELAKVDLPKGAPKAELDAWIKAQQALENAAADADKKPLQSAVDAAKEAFETKNTGDNAIAEDVLTKYKDGAKKVADAGKDAEKNLTEKVLSKYKIGNKGLAIGVGAAALALAALAIRPKAETEEV